jgi:hypothetical protein
MHAMASATVLDELESSGCLPSVQRTKEIAESRRAEASGQMHGREDCDARRALGGKFSGFPRSVAPVPCATDRHGAGHGELAGLA